MSLSAVFFHSTSFLFNFTSFEEKKYFRLFPICVYAVIIVYKYMSVFVFVIGCVWVECVSVCAFEIFSFYGFQNSQFFLNLNYLHTFRSDVFVCVCDDFVEITWPPPPRCHRQPNAELNLCIYCILNFITLFLHLFYTRFVLCWRDSSVCCGSSLSQLFFVLLLFSLNSPISIITIPYFHNFTFYFI